MDNYFVELNNVNVNDKTEKKNGLTYLSWAWAWGEVKKRHPDATYAIYENEAGLFYHTDGSTCWVKTGVTINGIEHIEYLPVMDYKNKSIPVDKVTSFDVNKAIQRSLTKAVARHGLGLYIYAGEDLPEEENTPDKKAEAVFNGIEEKPRTIRYDTPKESMSFICEECGEPILDTTFGGKTYGLREWCGGTQKRFGKVLCKKCRSALVKKDADK